MDVHMRTFTSCLPPGLEFREAGNHLSNNFLGLVIPPERTHGVRQRPSQFKPGAQRSTPSPLQSPDQAVVRLEVVSRDVFPPNLDPARRGFSEIDDEAWRAVLVPLDVENVDLISAATTKGRE